MATRCPDCHVDADALVRKDGTLRAHRRPALIPGGVAASDCSGVNRAPELTPVPDWIVEAFGTPATRGTRLAVGLARGTLVHLVEAGSAETLCGRRHGRNERHMQPGQFGNLDASEATCQKCIKAAT